MQDYKKSQKKILHLTTHLGGGVGKVVLNYIAKAKQNSFFSHKILCLGYADEKAHLKSKEVGFYLVDKMASEHRKILAQIADADIILIHWWNHPLLYDFLVREKLPQSRVIIWSHVSGLHPPNVFSEKILDYPDIFVFTTPISFKSKEVRNLPNEKKKYLRVVWSTGGVAHVKSIKPKKHRGFNIGYIGTVDYAKINENFLNICKKINIPDAKFIVCGGTDEEKIMENARQMGIADRFNFTGQIEDILEYLPIFDIFGYPLAPHHYGTCDQSLAESMAAGVVPVVLNNPMEKYMVKDRITGIVATDEKDYIKAIKELYENKELRNSLSKRAREYAIKTFSVDKMAKDWENIFKEALAIPKTPKKWPVKRGGEITAKDIFLESLGNYGNDFINYCNARSKTDKTKAMKNIEQLGKSAAWQSKTKGTAHNYLSYSPNDRHLADWSKLMKKGAKINEKR